jgi:hypothetical protein
MGKQLMTTDRPIYFDDTPATWAQALKDAISPEPVIIETAAPMTPWETFIDAAVRQGEWTPRRAGASSGDAWCTRTPGPRGPDGVAGSPGPYTCAGLFAGPGSSLD